VLFQSLFSEYWHNVSVVSQASMRTILLGVTGASSSGKSTVAHLLTLILPQCQIIHEDDFFKPEKEVPFDDVRGDRDWDCPEAIDFDLLIQTLSVLKDDMAASENPRAVVKLSELGYYEYNVKSTEPPRDDANFRKSDDLIITLKNKVATQICGCYDLEECRIYLVDGFLLLHNKELLNLFDLTMFFKTNYRSLKSRREKRLYTVDGNVWIDPPGYFDKFVWPGYYEYHKDVFIQGEDENLVKKTGGDLKLEFKRQYSIFEFTNNDDCDADALLKNVVEVIMDHVFRLVP
jgi:nicotinamide/nicotinate riboside kinase